MSQIDTGGEAMVETLRESREEQPIVDPLTSGPTFCPALAFTTFYAIGVALMCRALDSEAIGLGLRLQARLSFALYILALAGPGVHALIPVSYTAWLARQRPAFYQAFAVSHLIHGLWILIYFELTPARLEWNIANTSGVAAFPLISLLLLARVPRVSCPLRQHWARIEQGIVAYAWVQFVGFFFDRLERGRPELRPWYVIAIAISVLAAGLAWYCPVRGTHPQRQRNPA